MSTGPSEKEATELMRAFVQCHVQRKALRDQAAGLNRSYKELSSDVKALLLHKGMSEVHLDNVTVRLKDCKKAPSTSREFLGDMFKEFLQRSEPNMPTQQVDAQRELFLEFMRDFKKRHTKADTELQVLDRSAGVKM